MQNDRFIILDNPEEKGIDLEIEVCEGLFFRLFMEDEVAQQMIDIMQNKINARI